MPNLPHFQSSRNSSLPACQAMSLASLLLDQLVVQRDFLPACALEARLHLQIRFESLAASALPLIIVRVIPLLVLARALPLAVLVSVSPLVLTFLFLIFSSLRRRRR